MAIAVDASTPAFVFSETKPWVSGSFTPPNSTVQTFPRAGQVTVTIDPDIPPKTP